MIMKRKIQHALLALLKEHPLHEISIKQIAAQANIHRATFYVFYGSKEILYKLMVEEILFALEHAIQPAPHLTIEEIEQLYFMKQRPLQEAVLFLQHIETHRVYYEVLMKDMAFQQCFAEIISDSIFKGDILPRIYTQHMAYGAIGLVLEWLQHPEQLNLQEIASYLTRNIIHSLLDYQQQVNS